jgi:hypothetical protein
MNIEIREDSRNYACTVVKLPPKQKVEGLDKLVKVTVFGNDILTQKDADEKQLYLFFPAETRLDYTYLASNNEFRNTTFNDDPKAKGYFEDSGRVKSIKFKGVISTGYMAPVSTLDYVRGIDGMGKFDYSTLKEGDEFTDIDGVNICKKYKIVHQQSISTGESRFNKKLKRFDKLVPNQFRFHVDTLQLAKNLHLLHPEDIIVISDKWHGTSAVFSNVLINKKLDWKHKIAKFFGIDIVDKIHDHLYASRSVVKNQYINKDATAGYYNEDIWKIVHNEVKDKIELGISLYGEIVGYLPSGKMIQKGFDYGCLPKNIPDLPLEGEVVEGNTIRPIGEHKFLVYRITYTKPDGNVIEYSWQQIKNYCQKYQLEHVKELYLGKAYALASEFLNQPFMSEVRSELELEKFSEIWRNDWFNLLSNVYLEKDCPYNAKGTPAEGIVVRIDGKDTYSAYKLKSKRFLEKESKQLDEEARNNEINIEDETT